VQRGETVIAVCRTASEELKQLGVLRRELTLLQTSVADLRTSPGDNAINVLINNAGILKRVTLENLDFDSIREQFEVNALGALRVTMHFCPISKQAPGCVDDQPHGVDR